MGNVFHIKSLKDYIFRDQTSTVLLLKMHTWGLTLSALPEIHLKCFVKQQGPGLLEVEPGLWLHIALLNFSGKALRSQRATTSPPLSKC